MNVNEKIRMLRELNHWSQEEMAERLGMPHNGYAKIERGETKLYLEKLNQIAQIFNIDLSEFWLPTTTKAFSSFCMERVIKLLIITVVAIITAAAITMKQQKLKN